MRDPINAEIHKYREEHARQFNFDVRAICEDLRAMQQASNLKVVRLPPKRIAPKGRSRATRRTRWGEGASREQPQISMLSPEFPRNSASPDSMLTSTG